jgi:oxygen-dependent protoporphyrinogen oxidase
VAPRPHVVVVGGGVSGLTVAYALARAPDGAPPAVTLVEGDSRLGGKVRTEQVVGHPVDAGPDALLVRSPDMRTLLAELDLTEAVVAPGTAGAFIWSRGHLRPIPPGTVFGVPDRLLPVARSGLLSPVGLARAGLDLVLPRRPVPDDPSVGDLLRPRLGAEVFDRLVDPLLGGVHAGPADLLSARACVPEVEALVRGNRSLVLGMRRRRRPSPSGGAPAAVAASGPVLATLDGGLTRLVSALGDRLGDTAVRLGSPAVAVDQADGGRYRVHLGDGSTLEAHAVVLAAPAYAAAQLLAALSPPAAEALAEIPHADVASLTLVYRTAALTRPLDGTGFLVPPTEKRLLVGCSWLPAKWPQLADDRHVLIRGMVGRYGDTRFADLDDDSLAAAVHDELVAAMGLSAPPSHAVVWRWPQAMPQYTVGHLSRLQRIDRALAGLPGLVVTGAGYRGVGLASCVTQARQAAVAVTERLHGRVHR